jgi:hypothetical protein
MKIFKGWGWRKIFRPDLVGKKYDPNVMLGLHFGRMPAPEEWRLIIGCGIAWIDFRWGGKNN